MWVRESETRLSTKKCIHLLSLGILLLLIHCMFAEFEDPNLFTLHYAWPLFSLFLCDFIVRVFTKLRREQIGQHLMITVGLEVFWYFGLFLFICRMQNGPFLCNEMDYEFCICHLMSLDNTAFNWYLFCWDWYFHEYGFSKGLKCMQLSHTNVFCLLLRVETIFKLKGHWSI